MLLSREHIAELYGRHAFAVFRRCQQFLRNESDAEDMAQEVFVRALEKGDRFRGEARASTYLYAIATNLCLNRIRNDRARGEAWLAEVTDHYVPDLAPDPLDRISARRLAEAILEEADEVTAQIAFYHFADGLSQGEIAGMVGLSRVSVNKRLQKLRADAARLREGAV